MFVDGDISFDSGSPSLIPGQPNGDGNIIVDCPNDSLGDTHHFENSHTVTAAHEGPRKCDDGQIVGEALQGRIATRPSDTIENDVAQTDCGDELPLCETRKEYGVLISPKPEGIECAMLGAGGKYR